MEGYSFEYYTPRTWRERLDGLPFAAVHTLFIALLVPIVPASWWPDALMFMAIPIITHGMLHLCTHWSIRVNVVVAYSRQRSMEQATHVLITPPASSRRKAQLALKVVENGLTWFMFEQRRVIYDGTFRFLKSPKDELLKHYVQQWKDGGLTTQMATRQENLFGRNTFDIPLPEFWDIFREHAVSPFFVFQMFCVCLWLMDDYWYYSIMTAVMLIILEAQLVKRRIHDLQELRTMRIPPRSICVWRNKSWKLVRSDLIVPGDIVAVVRSERGASVESVPCDLLLLQGSVLVDEAMLTGESAPQLKVAMDDERGHLDVNGVHKQHVVYGGTNVVLHRNSEGKGVPNQAAIGYVLRTGFGTKQGKLVRTILFSAERVTVSSREAAYFLLTLLVFALASAGYTLYDGLQDASRSRRSTFKLVLSCTRILTSVVPPEFPITLSLAVTLSLVQLITKAQIYCTEPFRVPLCGRIDVCCFDKTGTLTSENFHVSSVERESEKSALILGACHSLVLVDGNVVGDPLERAAAERSGAVLHNDFVTLGDLRIDIKKRHPFSSELKRMTVVVVISKKNSLSSMAVLVKGAPEILFPFFVDAPQDLLAEARQLAKRGLRVLALGWRSTQEGINESREALEQNLNFCGLLCLTADIKDSTASTIKQLRSSNHRLVMITGDHPLTACHVAKEVGIVEQKQCRMLRGGMWALDDHECEYSTKMARKYGLCADGAELVQLSSVEFQRVVQVVSVFARVSPQQKEQILLALNQDNFTLMAGDGTNDVGALKAAHCGISILSSAVPTKKSGVNMGEDSLPLVSLGDASIASPFTSKRDNVRCVLLLLRTGRSTLSAVMQMYKIMALNSLVSALALSVLTLDGVKLGDGQTAIESICISVSFFLVSKSKPAKKLSKRKPATSVASPSVLISLLLQLAIHISTLILGWRRAREFRPSDFDRDLDGDFTPNIVNTVVFLLMATMHAGSFIANYDGAPFLRPLWENRPLCICVGVTLWTIILCALELVPELNEQLSLVPAPTEDFRRFVCVLVAVNLVGTIVLAQGVRLIAGVIEERKLETR